MNFYWAECRSELCRDGKWYPRYNLERLIVIADNDEEAVKNFNKSLETINDDKIRHVKTGKVYRCNGLLVTEDVFGRMDVMPV